MTLPRTHRRRLATVGMLTSAAMIITMVAPPATAAPATAEIRNAGSATAVADSYIVVLEDSTVGAPAGSRQPAVQRTADSLAERFGGTIGHVYRDALHGFEIQLSEQAAHRLAADPAVAYVEQNQVTPTIASGVQPNPPSWGLDRIDQRHLPLDNQYAYPNTAPNVHAYLVDTGIRGTHLDFGGRVTGGVDLVDGALPADDCNGHGTHLAGTVGGTDHGVAKAVQLHPVRVFGCTGSGTQATVIAGVDWITGNAVRPAVALMGLGGAASPSLDAAVTNSIASGITYAVASGSSNGNACNYSPARIPAALTAAGTTPTDTRMTSNNHGPCLDLHAPGSGITSTWYTSNTATATISGSSMAAAHVAGCAALVLSAQPTWSPARVARYLIRRATVGVVTGVPTDDTPNRLLYCGP